MHVASKFFGRGLVELWQFLCFFGGMPPSQDRYAEYLEGRITKFTKLQGPYR
jgi:hypothetical protein